MPPPIPEFQRKRWLLPALAVAAVLVAVACLELSRRAPQQPQQGPIFQVDPGPPPATPAPTQDRGPASDQAATTDPTREDAAVANLLDFLAGGSADPDAERLSLEVTKAFVREPTLKEAYDKYKRTPPAKRPSQREFLQSLKNMPEFRRLAARFASPGGSAASRSAGPGGTAPSADKAGSAGLRRFEGARGRDANQVAEEWRRKALSGVTQGATGRSLGAGGGALAGFGAAPAKGSWAGDVASARTGAAPNGESNAASPASGPAPAAAGTAGKNEALRSLTKPKDAASETMLRFCEQYSQFCSGNPPTVRSEFRPLFDDLSLIQNYGLWGACFRLRIFASCLGSCTGRCVPESGWTGCMEAYSDDATCVRECQAQSPCTVDPEVWDRLCVSPTRATPPRSPPSYCGPTPASPGECIREGGQLGSGTCCAGLAPFNPMLGGPTICHDPSRCIAAEGFVATQPGDTDWPCCAGLARYQPLLGGKALCHDPNRCIREPGFVATQPSDTDWPCCAGLRVIYPPSPDKPYCGR